MKISVTDGEHVCAEQLSDGFQRLTFVRDGEVRLTIETTDKDLMITTPSGKPMQFSGVLAGTLTVAGQVRIQ